MVAEDDDGENADEHGHNIEDELRISAADGVLSDRGGEASEEGGQNIERTAIFAVDAGVRAEADVEQHKTDGGGYADADAVGNSLNDFLADGEQGENYKENALDEDDAHCCGECLLVAQSGKRRDVCDNDGKEAVKTHSGSHCEGLVCGKCHDEHAYSRCDAGSHEHGVPQGSAGRKAGKQVGVERDDIRHGHECGETGDYLGADGGAVFLQLEYLFHFITPLEQN